jgi:hypothetical protein
MAAFSTTEMRDEDLIPIFQATDDYTVFDSTNCTINNK